MNEMIKSESMYLTNLSEAEKVNIFNALNNADYSITDCVGEKINVTMAFTLPSTINDEATGDVIDVDRTVLVDSEGKSYSTMSNAFSRAIKNYKMIFNEGDIFKDPVLIQVKLMGNGTKKYYTFNLVNE